MTSTREFLASGMAVTALVFSILGIVFSVTGAMMAILIVTSPIGFVFLITGGAFLAVGLLLGMLRMKAVNQREQLLSAGAESSGVITEVVQNQHVRINRKRPWIVRYKFDARGAMNEGSDTMMDLHSGYVPGARVIIAYDAMDARKSAIKRLE